MFKQILVSIDGSDHANKALDMSFDLAEKHSAKILILSVIPPMPNFAFPLDTEPVTTEIAVRSYYDGMKERFEKVISKAIKKAKRSKPNLEFSTLLVEGRPADKIVETAKNGGFDLVVMGSRGLGGVTEFILGSVSDRVADLATCPVLIVK